MRKSASTDFPQGRALILENIDGFLRRHQFFPQVASFFEPEPDGSVWIGRQYSTCRRSQERSFSHLPRTLAQDSGPNPDSGCPLQRSCRPWKPSCSLKSSLAKRSGQVQFESVRNYCAQQRGATLSSALRNVQSATEDLYSHRPRYRFRASQSALTRLSIRGSLTSPSTGPE